MLMSSLGNGYRLTRDDARRRQILARASIVADRYVPAVRAVRAFAGPLDAPEVNVITDTMMNLEILLWGARNGGDPSWRTRAIDHALTTRREHVRGDGSTYHVVVFDAASGSVLRRSSRGQGYSTSSVWARGHAWAMHGFTIIYRETGDPRFLDAARRTSDWFAAHLPADGVPFWDFRDPAIPLAPRDTSAAAIAASGLLELSRLETEPVRAGGYLQAARRIMRALASPPYLSQGTASPAVLLHGTYNYNAMRGIDAGLSWGDYFFLQAMLHHRLVPPATPALPVSAVTASDDDGNVPANVLDSDPATRWSALGDGQWIRVDLGEARLVSKLAISFYRGDERTARVEIATSGDGQSWTTHATAVSAGTTRAQETFDIPDTRARFVRVLGHGNSSNAWNSITELDIH